MKMTPEIEDLIDFDFDADPKGNQNSLIERGDTNDQDEGINEFNLKLIKSFEKTDRERNQLIRELYLENRKLKQTLDRKTSDTGHSYRCQRSQSQVENAAHVSQHSSQYMHTYNFVSVLIDGNACIFREDLLRKGAIGGAEAAYYLSGHIQKHIRRYNGADDWKIVVRVYIDLDSLLQSFAPTGLIDERDLLRHFSRGFAQHQPLFDIVDVGNVQNQVEVKIREYFELSIHNVQCQQVLLGYGNNQRLASLLKPYGTSVLDSQRITLVKKSHINDLYPSLEFPVVEFPSVFGPIKLSTRSIKASTKSNYIQRKAIESSPDFSENTLLAEDSEDSTSQDLNGNVSPPLNVFGKVPIVRQSSGGGPVLTKNQKIPTLWDPNKNVVLLNINDERVDTSLGKTDPEAEASLMKRTKLGKMCNDFHLRGFCRATDCPYMHEPELDYQELIVLRYRARRLFCERGSSCRVASCWYGHTCMYDKYCKQPTTCRFKDVHHVDKTAVAVWHKNRDQ